MSVVEKLKQRLNNLKEKETLPEISEEMKKVLGDQASGGEVWGRVTWKRALP